jgi:hypothetical protein
LWIDHLSFFQACSIGLLKSGSPSISQLWDVEADNVYRRFFHILSCYSQGVFQAGHPLVLVFSWLNDNLDDTWERRSNRVGRTARLIISDHPSMSLSSMPPRVRSSQSPFPHADSQVKSLIRRFISDSPTSQLSTPKNEIHDWLSSNHPHLALAYISPVQARRIIEYKDTLGHDI